MSRWIDGDWLLNFFEPYPDDYQTPLGTLRACVEDAPSIDIVRCKECKFWIGHISDDDGFDEGLDECRWRDEETPDADDFCSYGEREGE